MVHLLWQVLNVSLTASLVIAVVLLVRVMLNKAPKSLSYLLWGIVLFRLLCPVSVQSPLSILPSREEWQVRDSLEEGITGNDDATSWRAERDSSLPIQDILDSGEMETDHSKYFTTVLWGTVGGYIYLTGLAVMLLRAGSSYRKLRRKLAPAVQLEHGVYESDWIASPFVLGVVRPKIYLPPELCEQERMYILLHERCHVRRWDPLWKLLAYVALCLHWFNPLVWLAFSLAGKDMEMSCDEAVLRELGEESRANYAACLLSMATGRQIPVGLPLSFGEGDTKARIRRLSAWKKPAFGVVAVSLLVCAILSICLLTDPISEKHSAVQQTTGAVRLWFDYLDVPLTEDWNEEKTIEIPELPGVTFHAVPEKIWSENDVGNTILVAGMPIWNAFFCDLFGDGIPELLCTSSFGSGIIDSRITVVDYANGATYELEDRGTADYTMRLRADGTLWVTKTDYQDGTVLMEGRLVFLDDCLQIVEVDSSMPQYYLTIGDDHVATLEITAPGYSGGAQHADGKPYTRGEKVWLEALDGMESLAGVTVTALAIDGTVLWSASVPEEIKGGFSSLVQDEWELCAEIES